ncbi:MAG: DUF4349 domain-containing protein [Planctomycetota bacterium]
MIKTNAQPVHGLLAARAFALLVAAAICVSMSSIACASAKREAPNDPRPDPDWRGLGSANSWNAGGFVDDGANTVPPGNAIAGLFNKLPLLGDLPTIDSLFGFGLGDGDPTPPVDADGKPVRRVMVVAGYCDLVCAKPDEATESIATLAQEAGGYVDSQAPAVITVRIPAAKFDEFLAQVGALGDIENKQISAQDVTGKFVDLQARLRSALAVQARLRSLLERAENVPSALQVEEQLKRVDEEIERLKGQLAVLANQIAYSTLRVRLLEQSRPAPMRTVQGFGELPFEWLYELDPNRLWNRY